MIEAIKNNKIRLIDLTYALTKEVPHWSGGCGFQHIMDHDYLPADTQTKFRVHKLEMFAGVGTHMDAPKHCFPDGKCIADIGLEQFIAPCNVIDIPENAVEDYQLLTEDIINYENKYLPIESGNFVVVRTGWGKYWGDAIKYRNNLVFPTISPAAARMLVEKRIVGIGIDTLSPDNPQHDFPVHEIVLGTGKYIIENIANTHLLPAHGAVLCAMPLKIQDGTEAPMRLIAIVTK